MSDLEHQLPEIERLRAARDQLGQRVYALRTQIARTSAALRESSVSAGRRASQPSDVIAAGREQIAQHEARLRELAAAQSRARATIAQFEHEERHQDFLLRSLEALQTARATLDDLLDAVEQVRPPERKAIADLQAQMASADVKSADLQRSLDASRADDAGRRAQAAAARQALLSIAAERTRAREAIDEIQESIGALRPADGPSPAQLEERLASLNAEYAGVKAQWKATLATLHDAIKGIYVNPHPRDAVAEMPDSIPFLLLPLRIETRFVLQQSPAGPSGELLLRVYPDDIAIHTHEDELTEREITEGQRYWRTIYGIEKGTGTDKASAKTESWKAFAELFGPSRSAWVARSTRPTNWADLGTLSSADDLAFPAHDLTKVAAWSRAPRTHVMPDRFVVLLYEGGNVQEVVGNAIPDELLVGPEPLDLVAEDDQQDPDDAENSFVTVDGQLTFGSNYDWTSNFDRAVDQGMGFRIPILGTAAQNGFDKIVVLGVMASAGAGSAATMLETLLSNHQHSPKGLTLLRQGTATNNVDGQGSGYSVNDSLEQTREVTGLDLPLFTATSDTDGRALADALGLGYPTLQFVFNSDNTDGSEAVAMNRALYPGTLGYYFDTLLRVMDAPARDRLREFFVTRVTGRGPLPAIRVGNQPYGILLTSDFATWSNAPDRIGVLLRPDRFLDVLYAVLRRFDATWQQILPQLSFAGKQGPSVGAMLLDVLGLQAASATFAQRVGYSADYLISIADFEFGGGEFDELVDNAIRNLEVTDWLRTLGYDPSAADVDPRPQLLRLIYQHYTTTIDAANLVDPVPLSETAGIREYDTVGHRNYLHWLRDATTLAALSAQDFGGAPVPTALLYLKLRHALLLELNKSAVRWLDRKGYDASVTMSARTFYNIRANTGAGAAATPVAGGSEAVGDLSRWELMRAPVAAVTASPAAGHLSIADYLMASPGQMPETAYLAQMRQALDTLSRLSTARLERCLVEHLDTCTYRLDAWQTGLFATRLEGMRGTPSGTRGTYIGAYGWLEDVRPTTSWRAVTDVPDKLRSPRGVDLREYAGNGGFIHAPSINQAMAAALLRSGYLSYATPEHPDLMAVNLSSERVRRGLFILQGMRNGQSIEALLGYQFERGIHDRASADASLQVLNAFIVDIRIAYPIKRTRLGPGDAGGIEETVEAYDVVNGVSLVESGPPDWAAITGAPAAILTPPRVAALNAERERAADTLDAIKDVLLAESAYQLVQGNFDRAGAVLSSMKDAQAPPDLEVIKTPRSSHFTFTQRVAIHFPHLDPVDPAAAAWPTIPMTPRSLCEPGINQWLGDVLGSPDRIVFRVFEVQPGDVLVNPSQMTVEQLGLQPIDLVYILGADISTGAGARTGASELESRVAWRYRADHGLDERASVRIQFGEPNGTPGTMTMAEAMPLIHNLQAVLTDSRPLDARDYHTATTRGPGSTGPAATPSPGFDFSDLRARAEALQAQFGAVIDALLALPFTAIIGDWPVATLEDAFRELRANEGRVDLATVLFDFTTGDALTLQQLLLQLSGFGIADAFPRVLNVTPTEAKVPLVLQAMDAAQAAASRRTASATILANAVAANVAGEERAFQLGIDACKAILGNAFTVVPAWTMPNEAELLQSQADHGQLVGHAVNTLGMQFPEEEWIHGVAYVRPKVAAWERIRLGHETLVRTTLDLTAVQLPYRARDSWLGITLPDIDPATGNPFDIAHDTVSTVIHGASAFVPGALRSGILIDSWTETIPAREQSTGIAFHYNRPDAMPPQALLLAVPPAMTGHWSWDALVNIVNDTLRRAKLRAVEPQLLDQQLQSPELGLLLPAIIAEFQQYDLNVSLDLRMNLVALAPTLAGMYLNPNLGS